jgi:SulP family sulfate permease
VEGIVDKIRVAIAARHPPVKLLVIEASGIIDVDYTGSQLLQKAIADLKAKGVAVAIARLSYEQAQREALRSDLIETIGRSYVFMSVQEAVRKLGPGDEPGTGG